MIKKRIISFLLLFCFGLIAGHDIIPHDHLDDHSHLSLSGDHSDHDHEESSDENLNIFSYIQHSQNSLPTILHAGQIEFLKIKNAFISNECILGFHNFQPDAPPKILNSDIPFFQNFISSCSALRAPPTLFS